MRTRSIILLPALCCLMLASACQNDPSHGGSAPIVLGDPATIVTETDSSRLKDNFPEITVGQTGTQTNTAAPAPDTAVTAPARPAPANASNLSGNGLKLAFKEFTVLFPGISTRSFREQDPSRNNSVTYQLTDGKLQGLNVQTSGATLSQVSMRYQTEVTAQNELGTLKLDRLNTLTGWKPLKTTQNGFTITGLAPNQLEGSNASAASIRDAVNRAARADRNQRRNVTKWANSVQRVRSLQDAPLKQELRFVTFRIQGKDAQGRNFTKLVRLDVP